MNETVKKIAKSDFWENAYLVVLGFYLLIDVINTTMFKIQWPERFGYIQYAIIGGYGLTKFGYCIYKKLYNIWEILLTATIVGCFTVVAVITTSYSYLFPIAFLIIGAKNVDIYKILKTYIIFTLSIVLIAVVASQIGFIENLQYIDHRGIRNSMGIIYPTDFGAHVFYLVLAWICCRDERIAWCEILIIGVITMVVYYLSRPITSTVCIILMLFFTIIEKKHEQLEKNILIKKLRRCFFIIGRYAIIFFSTFYIFVQHIYNPASTFWNKIDDKISYRLMYTWYTLYDKKVKLLGQDIVEIGYGGNEDTYHDYMFLDDSYIAILMKYGVVIFIIVLSLFVIGQYRAYKSGMYILVIAGIVVSLHCVMEHHFLEIAYNPFLLVTFATLQKRSNERKA